MRLIDADAFKEYIRNSYEEVKYVYRDEGKLAKQVTEAFCEDIDDQPTIEPPQRCIATVTFNKEELEEIVKEQVEEIKELLPQKGKWIDYSDEGFVECPFCHSATNCDGNKDELHYCFSCGADMRSEAREYLEYGKEIAKGIEQGLRGEE